MTNAAGRATATRTVPTVVGGPKEIRAFAGNEVETTPFEVAPRVRVTPKTVQRGQSVAVAVTGFGPAEFVRIRWLVNGSYVQVGTLTTAINGTGSVNVTVPAMRPPGPTPSVPTAPPRRPDQRRYGRDPAAAGRHPRPRPRGTVNTDVDYTVANFPANASGTITWRRTSGSTIAIGTFQTTPPAPPPAPSRSRPPRAARAR